MTTMFGVSASDAVRLGLETEGITDDDIRRVFSSSLESTFRYSGAGSYYSRYAMALTQIDRYGYRPLPPNREHTGLTFITRPRLNLQRMNIRNDRILAWLDTINSSSIPFSIRAYLDTEWASQNEDICRYSPLFNAEMPFLVPITNALRGITGFPDFVVDTYTTEADFFGGDQTLVAGSNFNQNTNELTLTIQDIQGGYLAAMFLIWIRFMALVKLGVVNAYPDDIAHHEACYTCSVYRLVLDPSKRYVVKWGKGTGCFPVQVPIGAMLNQNDDETYNSASAQFSVTMKMNHFHPMDPIILQEFNTLVMRFAGNSMSERILAPAKTNANFSGIPTIDLTRGMNELQFWAKPQELENPAATTIDQMQAKIARLRASVGVDVPTGPQI